MKEEKEKKRKGPGAGRVGRTTRAANRSAVLGATEGGTFLVDRDKKGRAIDIGAHMVAKKR